MSTPHQKLLFSIVYTSNALRHTRLVLLQQNFKLHTCPSLVFTSRCPHQIDWNKLMLVNAADKYLQKSTQNCSYRNLTKGSDVYAQRYLSSNDGIMNVQHLNEYKAMAHVTRSYHMETCIFYHHRQFFFTSNAGKLRIYPVLVS